MRKPKLTPRRLVKDEILKVPTGTDPLIDGLWMVITEVAKAYVRGVVPIEGGQTYEVTIPRLQANDLWAGSPVHARAI